MFPDRENDVVFFQDARLLRVIGEAVNPRAVAGDRQAEITAIRRVFEGNNPDTGLGEAVVFAVAYVLEKMTNHGRRNEETGVLQSRSAHEGDSNHLVALENRPAAVAGVDGGIRLHRQERPVADVHVILHLDAGDNTPGVADLFASGRVTAGHHCGLNFRQPAKGQGLESVKKTGSVHLEHSKVAFVGDVFNTGNPWSRILKPTQNNLLGPTDNVGVGHDTIAVDHEPGAAGAGHWVVSPRGIPNRGLAVHQHLNDRAPHVRRRGQGGQERKKQGREENSHARKLLANPQTVKGKEKRPARNRAFVEYFALGQPLGIRPRRPGRRPSGPPERGRASSSRSSGQGRSRTSRCWVRRRARRRCPA